MESSFLEKLRKGDKLALSRILTQVESETSLGRNLLDEAFQYTGHAHKIGITGPPGSGKSSLVNALAREIRNLSDSPKVAILAVDPTSPFSGGAILGDRIRMKDLHGDSGVFIRSMASRGALGGLARTTDVLSQVFDAAGYSYILIETVGTGQAEVDIVDLAHTTIVVESPGLGDDIQSIKAGILEIADILVVNKADLPGADQTARNLENMIEMGEKIFHQRISDQIHHSSSGLCHETEENHNPNNWRPPVIRTIATQYSGIGELVATIQNHSIFLHKTDRWKEKDAAAIRRSIENMVGFLLMERWRSHVSDEIKEDLIEKVTQRRLSPVSAVEELLAYNLSTKLDSME